MKIQITPEFRKRLIAKLDAERGEAAQLARALDVKAPRISDLLVDEGEYKLETSPLVIPICMHYGWHELLVFSDIARPYVEAMLRLSDKERALVLRIAPRMAELPPDIMEGVIAFAIAETADARELAMGRLARLVWNRPPSK